VSEVSISALKGLAFVSVEGCSENSEELKLTTADGRRFVFFHDQNCCEHVCIAQVDGDPGDLLRAPLEMAEESTESGESDGESYTRTFYKFATTKGYVTVRWLGTSNGYYGEEVSLREEAAEAVP
jgi:hypothetical protein